MLKSRNIFHGEPETLEEKYFSEIRPKLYKLYGTHAQYGIRKGRSLAEHLDSACQFVLSVSKIAQVPEHKRPSILAATAVHDLNKLDKDGRSVKTLARDRSFLQAQLERACVAQFVQTEEDLELVRRLIERHSDHNSSDGMRFLPEDPNIKRWAAMLVSGDLFDLGIEESKRVRKVEKKLRDALQRDIYLFKVSLSEDRGYFTSLLLSACESVLCDRGLQTLAIEPDGQIFVGEAFPEEVTLEIAQQWQKKIERVFSSNVEQLVCATKDGIKIDSQAIQQNPEATLDQVDALLVKKANGYKVDKVARDIQKYGEEAGEEAIAAAAKVGLSPVSSADEFAVSEGLKAAYLSYRNAGLSTTEVWDYIAKQVQLSPEQRLALEPFNPQYGRCLFAAAAIPGGVKSVYAALENSFQLRQTEAEVEVSQELVNAVEQLLNFPHSSQRQCFSDLTAYIEAKPDERCSLGTTSPQIEKLVSNKMPPGTKVQAFSNRLPGGTSAEPKRRADTLAALSYQLMAVAANFPKANKQDPLYLHFALPKGSNPALQSIWQQFLQRTAQTHEDGTVTVDELQLYRDYEIVFKANKVVGLALPKRPEFIRSTVTIPVVWGDVNNSVALLKSLRLALEMALALDFGFPFVLSANLEIEPAWDIFGRVEGIPSSLQPLLGTGQYRHEGHLLKQRRVVTAEAALTRLQCLGKLAVSVASLPKKDDCLYDLARAATRPLNFYYVLLRWVLREQDDPNLEAVWTRIKEPLNTLLESLMSQEHERISTYLKQAAHIAEVGKLRGSSFRRTAQAEPFSEFIKAIRARKSHLDWETVFAALVQQYHNRLDRIREHGVGATKFEQIKQFYQVLQKLFEEVYHSRPERLLTDSKTLEAAYLFFLQEARQELKSESAKAETK